MTSAVTNAVTSTPAQAEATTALQATLAAEQAAVYVYSVLGARTSESQQPALYQQLRAAYDVHHARRDALVGELAGAGATPSPAAVAYALPAGIDTVDGVTAAALALEQGSAKVYAALVAATTGDQRRSAVGLLDDAAVRALLFRGTPEIFPGAEELADR